MYRTGNDRQELLDLLEELSELTGMDRVPKVNQTFRIDAQVTDHGGFSWSVTTDPGGFSSAGAEKMKGTGYVPLMQAVSRLDAEEPVDERFVILGLAQASGARNYDGSIHTVWFLADPCTAGMDAPVFRDGKAEFTCPVLETDLTEAEYKACAVSRVAFYDEINDVIYPVQECAYQSVNGVLHSHGLFRPACSPLPSAWILAERLAARPAGKSLRLISRKRTDRVRPLIGLAGKLYEPASQARLVRSALDALQTQEVVKVATWTVTDELTRVVCMPVPVNAMWQPEIELCVSDISGTAVSATAWIRMGRGRILLRRNATRHTGMESMEPLCEGLMDEIAAFGDAWDSVCGCRVPYSAGMLKHKKILGKRRTRKLVLPENGTYEAGWLIREIAEATHAELNDRWSRELGKANLDFFRSLVKAAQADVAGQDEVPAAV